MTNTFIPKPGQVDYTDIRYCPVINVIPMCEGKILLVQRASGLTFYPDYWHCIAGFLDDEQSIEEKAYEELGEELGWPANNILTFERGQVVLTEAPEYHKTYLVVPLLARVNQLAEVKLDWEASRAKWFEPGEINKLNLLPGFLDIARQFLRAGREAVI